VKNERESIDEELVFKSEDESEEDKNGVRNEKKEVTQSSRGSDKN
jgi:hypothetical protein